MIGMHKSVVIDLSEEFGWADLFRLRKYTILVFSSKVTCFVRSLDCPLMSSGFSFTAIGSVFGGVCKIPGFGLTTAVHRCSNVFLLFASQPICKEIQHLDKPKNWNHLLNSTGTGTTPSAWDVILSLVSPNWIQTVRLKRVSLHRTIFLMDKPRRKKTPFHAFCKPKCSYINCFVSLPSSELPNKVLKKIRIPDLSQVVTQKTVSNIYLPESNQVSLSNGEKNFMISHREWQPGDRGLQPLVGGGKSEAVVLTPPLTTV